MRPPLAALLALACVVAPAPALSSARWALESAGVESRLRVYQGVGHAYPSDARGELVRAFRFALGEDRP